VRHTSEAKFGRALVAAAGSDLLHDAMLAVAEEALNHVRAGHGTDLTVSVRLGSRGYYLVQAAASDTRSEQVVER
jgi:hypothetical protein